MKSILVLMSLCLFVACTPKSSTSSLVTSVIKENQRVADAVNAAFSGCVAKGLSSDNPNVVAAIVMTQGQVCSQVVAEDIKESLAGKGLCVTANKKCLFSVGYIKTALVLAEGPLSEESQLKLSAETDVAFEKLEQEEKARKN